MASKKITQLPVNTLPTMDGVMPIVLSGTTYQSNLIDLRQNLVDSGSHIFTGSQVINGNLVINGKTPMVGSEIGSLYVNNSGSIDLAKFIGNHDIYTEVNIQNTSNSQTASSDIVVMSDVGTTELHYVNLGINSSTYNTDNVGRENDSYLLNSGNSLYIGTLSGADHQANLNLFTEGRWESPQIFISGSGVIGFNTNIITDGYQHEFSGSTKVNGFLGITATSEVVNVIESATDTIEQNFINGSIYYYSGITTNFIVNFTNTPLINNAALSMTLVLVQGQIAFFPTEYQINGEAQTINWPVGLPIVGSENKIDIISVSLLRVNSTWTLIGQLSTFG